MDLTQATRLDLFEAKARLATLTDRQLIQVIPQLRKALGMDGYGGDYARETKSEKLSRACSYAESISNKIGHVPATLVLGTETPKEQATVQAQALPIPAPQAPSSNGAANNAANKLAEALGAVLGDVLTEGASIDAKINAAVNKALAERIPNRVEIVLGELPPIDCTDKHPLFPLIFALCKLPRDLRPNILLVGPAGCGKTTLGAQVAEALTLPFGATSLSAGVSESILTGWLLPVGEGGRFQYVPSGFVRDYALRSAVHLLDELDAMDPNVGCVVNAALANGHIHVQQRLAQGEDPSMARNPESVVICAANTFGTGADDLYVGRNALDAATLDRFLIIELGYPEALELQSMGIEAKAERPWAPSASSDAKAIADDLKVLGEWIMRLRKAVAKQGIRRVVSFRMFQRAKALRAIGCSVTETQKRLLTGWTTDDLAAVKAEGLS